MGLDDTYNAVPRTVQIMAGSAVRGISNAAFLSKFGYCLAGEGVASAPICMAAESVLHGGICLHGQ